jgi:hypothetical protein
LPFFTQVIVFFLLFGRADGEDAAERDGVGEPIGVGDSLAIGELDGLGLTISATVAVAEGVGVALATGIGFANDSLSYATFPSAFLTLAGKFSGKGVSDKCFITERTSGRKFGNTCAAPSAVMPALRVRISVRRLR